MEHVRADKLATFWLSLTVMLNVYVCGAGAPAVPASTPADDSVSPAGKLPVAVYVYPGVPPVPTNENEYAEPTFTTLFAPDGHVVDGGGNTVNVQFFELLPPAESVTLPTTQNVPLAVGVPP